MRDMPNCPVRHLHGTFPVEADTEVMAIVVGTPMLPCPIRARRMDIPPIAGANPDGGTFDVWVKLVGNCEEARKPLIVAFISLATAVVRRVEDIGDGEKAVVVLNIHLEGRDDLFQVAGAPYPSGWLPPSP